MNRCVERDCIRFSVTARYNAGMRSQRTPLLAILALLLSTAEAPVWSADRAATRPPWAVRLGDLNRLAKESTPETARLFQALAQPTDQLTVGEETLRVVPLPLFPASKGMIRVRVAGGAERDIDAAKVVDFVPFEKNALELLSPYLGATPSLEKLSAGETALCALLHFHQATRLTPDAAHNPWRPVRTLFEDRLREVRDLKIEQLAAAAKTAEDWGRLLDAAEHLQQNYPQDRKLQARLTGLLAGRVQAALEAGDLTMVRDLLRRIDLDFVRSPEAAKARDALQNQAAALLKEAEPLPDAAARTKLQQAYGLWPRLPGLADALARRQNQERVLHVGVPALPEALSPAAAATDAELAAVELLFEGLVHPVYSEAQGQRYVPQLADDLPNAEPLRRRFELRRQAYWSTGERVTATDIRHTAQFCTSPGWRDLVETPQVEPASLQVDFRLRQGFFDPLGLLAFKIVPQTFHDKPLQPDDPEFAVHPVGSGPYTYSGRVRDNGRLTAVFRANPNYVRYIDILPKIREIRMFAWPEDGKQDKAAPAPDLIIDVPADRLADVRKSGKYQINALLPNRVYFLALNHRVKALADGNVRRALAHGIDRKEILDACFRRAYPEIPFLGIGAAAMHLANQVEERQQPQRHRALNGPYPADSWACSPPPRVPADLHDAELAKARLLEAAKVLQGVELTLKYPIYDPRTAAACAAIAQQFNELAEESGVRCRLKCVPLPPAELRKAIAERDFDLAYMQHEFADETYWLWPWFDPRPEALAKGGSNFLGYENDGDLLTLLRAAMSHREFATLQAVTHTVHAHLHEHMPFIPLWQLQRSVAMKRDLLAVYIDPLHVFSQVERWRFQTP